MNTVAFASATIGNAVSLAHGNSPVWGSLPVVRLHPGRPINTLATTLTTIPRSAATELYQWIGPPDVTEFVIVHPTPNPQPKNYPTGDGAKPWEEYVSSMDKVVTEGLSKAYKEMGTKLGQGEPFELKGVTPYVPAGASTAAIVPLMYDSRADAPTGMEKAEEASETEKNEVPSETKEANKPSALQESGVAAQKKVRTGVVVGFMAIAGALVM